jgi:hypothetical protein
MVLLPQSPRHWDLRCASPCLALPVYTERALGFCREQALERAEVLAGRLWQVYWAYDEGGGGGGIEIKSE